MSTLFLEADRAIGHDRLNMATFMVLFLLITIEVVVVKVVTFEMEHNDDNGFGMNSVALFFERDD